MEEAPAKALVDLADARDARVIVVGTRGESPLHARADRLDAAEAGAHVDRPVLVVPLPSTGADRRRTATERLEGSSRGGIASCPPDEEGWAE